MRAVIYDGVIRKLKSTIIFIIIAGLILTYAALTKETLPYYLFLILSLYYNGFVKQFGSPTQWKLLWSLPLTDGQIILGQAGAWIILGFGTNLILYLICLIWAPLPIQLLVLVCLVSLITDVFTMALQLIKDKNLMCILLLGWAIIVYGAPFVLRKFPIEAFILSLFEQPWYIALLPFLFIYLLGLIVIASLYRYFRKTYDFTAQII